MDDLYEVYDGMDSDELIEACLEFEVSVRKYNKRVKELEAVAESIMRCYKADKIPVGVQVELKKAGYLK